MLDCNRQDRSTSNLETFNPNLRLRSSSPCIFPRSISCLKFRDFPKRSLFSISKKKAKRKKKAAKEEEKELVTIGFNARGAEAASESQTWVHLSVSFGAAGLFNGAGLDESFCPSVPSAHFVRKCSVRTFLCFCQSFCPSFCSLTIYMTF